MARMYPNLFNADETASSAEARLYDLFRDHLPPDCIVFHSRMFQDQQETWVKDAEIDFLIAHPKYGIFVLEVKGGRIFQDGEAGKWYSIDRQDKRHVIKNPVKQARDTAHGLERYLREVASGFDWTPYYAIAFPDVDADNLRDAQLDRAIVLDRPDLHPTRVAAAVDRIFKHYRPRGMWANGGRAIQKLQSTLTPRYILTTSLATEFTEEEDVMKQLTDQQFEILNFALQMHPRLIVTGVAGSGKTLIALEKARRLANDGQRVLYTCYNANLAQSLNESPHPDGLTVQHFHALAREHTGREYTDALKAAGLSSADFYDAVLPNALAQKAQEDPTLRFDAILIDEGQDFKASYWPAVMAMLRDRDKTPWFIFCDDAQRIYSTDALPTQFQTTHIPRNMRNVRPIGEEAGRYRRAQGGYEAVGPMADSPIKRVEKMSGKDGLLKALRDALEDLRNEKVKPSQIMILTPMKSRSSLQDGEKVGPYTLRWAIKGEPNEICVQTIQSFKGLERAVIILTELDRAQHLPNLTPEGRDSLFYVALSRAKHKLVIIGSIPDPSPK